MNCEASQELLSPYLDGELAPDEHERTSAHLDGCEACRARLESYRALKHALARLPAREAPPEAVRVRIEAARQASRQGAGAHRTWLLASLAAGGMALAASLLLLARGPAMPDGLADALAADHLESVPAVKPMQIASGNPVEVARFFAGTTPFAPVVPGLPETRLLGGRACKIEGRRVELLFYDDDGRVLSLFVSDRPLGTGCRQARGLTVCSRDAGELSFVLVGDRPEERLSSLLESAAP